jgi:hypothetical protein
MPRVGETFYISDGNVGFHWSKILSDVGDEETIFLLIKNGESLEIPQIDILNLVNLLIKRGDLRVDVDSVLPGLR